eukprot:TRINITY_DN3149_c0_g1_i2.p1 TRINITY_DN3149_c0_g1~~TRINITY_DN3149_c0_g1_i2.p1  ORF type:complete len:223 (-),score=33.15 TRINITY_DN3149_c0_g1_i2:251-919(-)
MEDKLRLYEEHDGIREYTFKILVVGDIGTGKTSLVKRLKFNTFSDKVNSTVGVDFVMKEIKWEEKKIVRLQLWDIAGQERFGNLTRVYYKEAVGVFCVYDVSRTSTFENTKKWKSDIDDKVKLPHDGETIPMVLLANKCDLLDPKVGLDAQQLDIWCDDCGFAGWEETSAKENTNIDKAVSFLVCQIFDRIKEAEAPASHNPGVLKVGSGGPAPATGGGCCG